MPDLRLEVPEYTSASEWRWLLTDVATGRFLADHEVCLEPASSQFESSTHLNFDVADLCSKLGEIPGDPALLISKRFSDPKAAEEQAQALAEEPADDNDEQDAHPHNDDEEPSA